MSKSRHFFRSVLVLVAGLHLAVNSIEACSCISANLDDSFSAADVVFTGKVLSISEREAESELPKGIQKWMIRKDQLGDLTKVPVLDVRLEVELSFKNIESKFFTVTTSGECRFSFEKEKQYVVFASNHGRSQTPFVFLCNGTKLLDSAGEDIVRLHSLIERPAN